MTRTRSPPPATNHLMIRSIKTVTVRESASKWSTLRNTRIQERSVGRRRKFKTECRQCHQSWTSWKSITTPVATTRLEEMRRAGQLKGVLGPFYLQGSSVWGWLISRMRSSVTMSSISGVSWHSIIALISRVRWMMKRWMRYWAKSSNNLNRLKVSTLINWMMRIERNRRTRWNYNSNNWRRPCSRFFIIRSIIVSMLSSNYKKLTT